MASNSKITDGLAWVFRINVDKPERSRDEVTRGESVYSTHSQDTFVEEAPTTIEFFHDLIPTGKQIVDYLISLFPFLSWIGFYNLQWLVGDLVAGITIGAVVVPQGMAYAKLALLPVQFGLYSSFMGVLIYWFFATSKDITIGPVAVMSTVTGNVITNALVAMPQYKATPWVISEALSIIAGSIVLFLGLMRWGRIVDLIPLTSLASFMTGSALNILVGQVPGLLGLSSYYSSRDATYLVIINTMKWLDHCSLDAAIGLTSLLMLYIIKEGCNYGAKKQPHRAKLYFFIATLRTAFVILLYTLISWLVNMWINSKPKFSILGTVPSGFQNAGVPKVNLDIIRSFVGDLPVSVIVLLIEHIAISKSFGRVNNYTINPSQEMVAIGVTNVLAPFLGGYPSTGSFSRTAIKAKAGVRTPLAGVITAIVVLLAIYALTAVFFYIPNAALSAVIIHAVVDLITPPDTLYRFWQVNPLEVFIWAVGVIITIFTTIEIGIYCTISISAAVFILRILISKGRFLGRVSVHTILGEHVLGNDSQIVGERTALNPADLSNSPALRNIFIPIEHSDGTNPDIKIGNPYPGVFIYRFSDGFIYPNAGYSLDHMVQHIFATTRRTKSDSFLRRGDRPWNDPGPRKGKEVDHSDRPTLKAIILDFSTVNNIDITAIQALIDVRNQLDRYTNPDIVDWHIACINNRWTKRALVSAGFGYPTERPDGLQHRWRSIFSITEIGGEQSVAATAENEANEKEVLRRQSVKADGTTNLDSIERADTSSLGSIQKGVEVQTSRRKAVVHGLNRPLFHVDLTSALQSAVTNIQAREQHQAQVSDSAVESI